MLVWSRSALMALIAMIPMVAIIAMIAKKGLDLSGYQPWSFRLASIFSTIVSSSFWSFFFSLSLCSLSMSLRLSCLRCLDSIAQLACCSISLSSLLGCSLCWQQCMLSLLSLEHFAVIPPCFVFILVFVLTNKVCCHRLWLSSLLWPVPLVQI